MSFGFSVGDFIAGARLAITLSAALTDSKGSSKEYQELIALLNVVHKVLLQVEQLRAANQLAQSTVNALLFAANSANAIIESFLDRFHLYQESLIAGGSGNRAKDAYRKMKWSLEMPDHVSDLKQSLATMLAAVNCLVSLASYYNTGYDPRCNFTISYHNELNYDYEKYWKVRQGKDIRIAGRIDDVPVNVELQGFEIQKEAQSFFRPGQIFMAEVKSSLHMANYRGFRRVDFGNLPLGSISTLRETADAEDLEDRRKRLVQIQNLPLSKMLSYCRPKPSDQHHVTCSLCNNEAYLKDAWLLHFRFDHWRYYFSMVPDSISSQLMEDKRDLLVSREEITNVTDFDLIEKWITLKDITSNQPIWSDEDIIWELEDISSFDHYLTAGPIMIRRFVVVHEGGGHCLCLGIHTYARQGCGSQPDQEMFSVIHSGKEPSVTLPDEKNIVLSPIRMKPDHPSTALPRSARIHYGRAYDIDHRVAVQSLGQIHPTSMETLLDQFEANVFRRDVDEHQIGNALGMKASERGEIQAEKSDNEAIAADMDVVRDMRENITKVLGTKMSPADNPPSLRPEKNDARSGYLPA